LSTTRGTRWIGAPRLTRSFILRSLVGIRKQKESVY
jgi:hypothetical protein